MKNSKAILQVPGTMKIISAEIPVPKEDEVLIKVEYVGICGSDVHGFESGPFIPPKDPNQEIGPGHECAGTVVAVEAARKFKPGSGKYRTRVPLRSLSFIVWKANITFVSTLILWRHNPTAALTHYLCHPRALLTNCQTIWTRWKGAGGACRSRDACRDAGRC